ncbi:threonine/serine exporter family protein [Saccharicrinis sp. FJH2]|uniref:threonine/serine exporter family protein n=1 Tax=Saccharicrinis sp. FJH65 TaxID=3344659 RepID=UPI0035F2CBD6
MEWLAFLEKGIWLGFAAIGFAILFNVPLRTLKVIFVIGALGGLVKFLLLKFGINITIASFGGAVTVGFVSSYAAHYKHAPPMVFAIPAVIPMVPGVFTYRMMLGLMQLTEDVGAGDYNRIMAETVNNGLKASFILLALALGVGLPILLSRKESVKKRA